MIDQLIGQFLSSQDGKSTVAELSAHGLDQQQATSAVTATAQGVASQLGGGGDPLSALLGGGSGGAVLGALGGLFGGGSSGAEASPLGGLGSLLGGGSSAASNPLAGLAGPIGHFVAEKTGLAPALAQTVVSVVLPKVVAWFQSNNAATQA